MHGSANGNRTRICRLLQFPVSYRNRKLTNRRIRRNLSPFYKTCTRNGPTVFGIAKGPYILRNVASRGVFHGAAVSNAGAINSCSALGIRSLPASCLHSATTRLVLATISRASVFDIPYSR